MKDAASDKRNNITAATLSLPKTSFETPQGSDKVFGRDNIAQGLARLGYLVVKVRSKASHLV